MATQTIAQRVAAGKTGAPLPGDHIVYSKTADGHELVAIARDVATVMDTVGAVGDAGPAQTLDASIQTYFSLQLTEDCRITLQGAEAGKAAQIDLLLTWDGLGPWVPIFGTQVQWTDDIEPDFASASASEAHLTFVTYDGTVWHPVVEALSGQTSPTANLPTFLPAEVVTADGPTQVLDFNDGEIFVGQGGDCQFLFKNLESGKAKELIVHLLMDGAGQHAVSFPGVNFWLTGPFDGSSNPNGAAPQSAITMFRFRSTFGGLAVSGEAISAAPQPPDPPRILTANASSTGTPTITLGFQPPRVFGADDDLGNLVQYAVSTRRHSDQVQVDGQFVDPAGALTATITGNTIPLVAGVAYDVSVVAINGYGPSTAAVATATPTTTAGRPGTPTNLIATNDDGSTTITFGPPSSDGGSTLSSYIVTVTSPAIATPTIVQRVKKTAAGTTVGVAPGLTTDSTPGDWTQVLTPGNKLLAVTTDNSNTGTRTVSCTTLTMSQYKAADNTDCHGELWDADIGSITGTPGLTFSLTGAGSHGPIWLEVYEVSGLGARDTAAAATGPQRFADVPTTGQTKHFPAGTTGTLAQASSWLFAVWSMGADGLIASYVVNDGTPLNDIHATDGSFSNTASPFVQADQNGRSFMAAFTTSATTPVGVALRTTVATDGTGFIAAYKTATGSAFSQTRTITLPAALTTTIAVPNGPVYTVSVVAHNGIGNSLTPATTTVHHATTSGGGGTSVLAQARGVIASNTQTRWSQEMSAISSLTPAGTMSMAWIFLGVAGLDVNTGEGSAWGDWQFYVDPAGNARPRPSIFIYLCDSVTAPGAGVTLVDMAGASPTGTARQQNAWNRATAIASYFAHSEIANQNPIFRLGWEMDQGWNGWFAGNGNQTNFINAYRKFHDIIKAACPTATFDFNVSAGCGGGPFTWNHGHSFWDSFYPGTSYVDVVGIDVYADLPISVFPNETARTTWLNDELDAFQAWVVSLGKPVSCPEHGISDPTFYTGVDSGNTSSNFPINGVTFIDIMVDWFQSLPASGPGRLLYCIMFDAYDPADPASTGYRGLRNVPVYGAAAANRWKLRMNV